MIGIILLTFIAMGVICYSTLTYQLMKERCRDCGKPSRCAIGFGIIYGKPFVTRCVHCDAELN